MLSLTFLDVGIFLCLAAALLVAQNEPWRQLALKDHIRQLSLALGISFQSAICPILIGGEKEALDASRLELKKKGFFSSLLGHRFYFFLV